MTFAIIRYPRNVILLIPILLFLYPSSWILGQEEKAYNQQAWMDLNPRWIDPGGKISIASSIGYRTIFPEEWNRYLINLGFRYSPFIHRTETSPALQYLQFRAGITDYYTSYPEDQNINEVRLYQGVRIRWPIFRRVRLIHYPRIEERFENIQGTDTREFSFRIRYRLTTEFRFIKTALTNLYVPISAELFINTGGGIYFRDLTRITPGIGYDFTDQFATEFQLSYHFSRNSSTESFQNNEVVYRLRVYISF